MKIEQNNNKNSNKSIITFNSNEDLGIPILQKQISFNYQTEKYGALIEITGFLREFHSGRDYELKVEPDEILDEESDKIWSDNWEDIEIEIIDSFYKNKVNL